MLALHRLIICFALLACHKVVAASPLWTTGSGDWTDAPRWGGTLPDPTGTASIEGTDTHVTFSSGDVLLSRLNVAAYHTARSALTMTGGQLTASNLILLGEATGTSGRLVQTGGDLRALEICVGAANLGPGTSPGPIGELEVSGGSLLTRHLTFGWGTGSTARLHIIGSNARPIAVLDYLWIGIRSADPSPGSAIAFDYDIDSHGVTPIVLWQPTPIALIDSGSRSTCHLHIALKEKPPVGDIPLIRLKKPCSGTFTDLPEGSPIRADFDGQTYEWTLTYKGGTSKADITLTNPHLITAAGKQRTPHTTGTPAKSFPFTADDVQSGLREMERRQTAILPPFEPKGTPAFPGAEGYGAYTPGGRGGKAIYVTTLADSGPGSLREALDTKGPRTILFRVGGVIQLKSSLVIREPFVTIAGQSAPGICLRTDSSTHADTLVLSSTHDVVLRHLRVQNGKGPQPSHYDDGGDCISAYDSQNFIIDHCSAHWGCDEGLSVTGSCDRYTIQWTLIAEGLNYNRHSMATILSGERCTWHHNLLAHNGSRNPLFAGSTRCDFRNNVLYNWGHTSGQGNFTALNYTGNYLRPGPSTRPTALIFIAPQSVPLAHSLHLTGNIMEGKDEITADNWLGATFDRSTCAHPISFPMAPVPSSESATAALPHVLEKVGATLPQRDPADTRVITDAQNHTGQIIDSQDAVGGHPTYEPTTSTEIDTDLDGLPDPWELTHSLNPHSPTDATLPGPTGYTPLELYLNSLPQ